MIPEDFDDKVRARQKGRAVVMAVALAVFVILVFAITLVKMSIAQ